MRKIAFLLAAPFALAACGPALEFPIPPADKLVCAEEPDAPDGRVTDERAGQYMQALRGAWQDCHGKVMFLRDWHAALARAAKKAK